MNINIDYKFLYNLFINSIVLLFNPLCLIIIFRFLSKFVSATSYSMTLLYTIMTENEKFKTEQSNGKLTKDERKLRRYYDTFLGSF